MSFILKYMDPWVKWNMRLIYVGRELEIISARNYDRWAFYVITYLCFVHLEGWITLSMLVHIITFTITLTYVLLIGVVIATDEIDRCTMVRSSDQIQQKSTKIGGERYIYSNDYKWNGGSHQQTSNSETRPITRTRTRTFNQNMIFYL
jgi:hypothetical protein